MPDIREQAAFANKAHSITLEGRNRMTLTGVSDVPSFCEQTIVAETSDGSLTVIGEELHISRLHLGEGIVQIEGRVSAMEYADRPSAKGKGVFGRLLK